MKALCAGAKGVGMGRPFLYSLTYGQEGVTHAIESESAFGRSFVLPCCRITQAGASRDEIK